MIILAETLVGCAVLLKIVIDQSMTILAETLVGCAVLVKVSLTGQ